MITAGLQITQFGDWKQVEGIFADLSQHNRPITRDAARGARFFAQRYRNKLIDGILTNGSSIGQNWPAVSDKYARFKVNKFGTDPGHLLRASFTYIEELMRLQITQKKFIVTMQFRKGALQRKAWKKGITLRYYSVILEEGRPSQNIKARPLWEPAFYSIGGYQGAINSMNTAINQRLRKLGITINFRS